MAGDELTCTVLFFAAAADAVGCRETSLSLPIDATAGDALGAIAETHEALAAIKDQCAIAVDHQLGSSTVQLHDGCTVAILPPVSGG